MDEPLQTLVESAVKSRVRAILDGIDDGDFDRRTQAESDLRELGADAIPHILQIIRAEQKKRHRREWIFNSIVLSMMAGCAIVVIAGEHAANTYGPYVLALLVLGVVGFWLLPAYQLQRNAAYALTIIEDLDTIGPLIDAIGYRSDKLRPHVFRTLTRLLPYLPERPDLTLTSSHRQKLEGLLAVYDSPANGRAGLFVDQDMALAIVKALAHGGNGQTIQKLERLSKSKRHPEIASAAAEALPLLRERIAQANFPERLLRPTDADEHVLLRAATSAATSPDTLVRAAESPDSVLHHDTHA